MKKIIFSLLLVGIGISTTFSQEKATDFTAEDCNGEMHHLFAELDAGKVVIIAWVMPCAACIEDPAVAFSLADIANESFPDKVLFYMADDYANTSCSTLIEWAATYGMGKSTIFSDETIKMSDYGEDGMPKIVILGGGGEHKVYFNKNSSSVGFEDALLLAISESQAVGTNELSPFESFKSFPNPIVDKLNLSFELKEAAIIDFNLFNVKGSKVQALPSEKYQSGMHQVKIDCASLHEGVYLLRMNVGGIIQTQKILIAH
jgi:hypothetical protein